MTADNEARELTDEELLAANREGIKADMDAQFKKHGYASSAERRALVAGLRAVAALASRPVVPAAIEELIAELRHTQGYSESELRFMCRKAADALESLLAQTAGGQK